MDSIPQKYEKENKNTKRYLPHDLKTKIHAVETYRNSGDIEYTCRKYHISRYSLWRWNKKYDGTKESLEDKSHKPKTRHPNAHTNQEIRWIRNYVKRNPRFLYSALYDFDNRAVMDFFERRGCHLKTERGGRVFPVSKGTLEQD